MRVVATAGHVDHGKSTLLRALTGMEPDRWEEERARGLTIDLGFVWTDFPRDDDTPVTVAFVDVPGHERFIGNMLAGAGAVDLALFVVAADDGWSAQSQEHLDILDLLGIEAAVAAVTKVATVDEARATEVAGDVERRLGATSLAGAPVVLTDAVAGQGLDDLRTTLLDRLAARPPSADHGRPRMWVDRSFTVSGAGTVVTGTLTGGGLHTGDTVTVLPAGTTARIRGLQSLGAPVDRAAPGSRVAVNLAGIDRAAVRRGDAVVGGGDQAGRWVVTRQVDAWGRALPGQEIDRTGAWHLHVGSAEVTCTPHPLLGDPVTAHSPGYVRIDLHAPLPLQTGDRFVLRESGRRATVGGGEVLDPAPTGVVRGIDQRLEHSDALDAVRTADDRLAPLLAAAGGARPAVDARAGAAVAQDRPLPPGVLEVGDWLVTTEALDRLTAAARHAVAGNDGTEVSTASRERLLTAVRAAAESAAPAGARLHALAADVLDHLVSTGVLARRGSTFAPADEADALDEAATAARERFLDRLRADALTPPDPEVAADDAGLGYGEVQRLVQSGAVVRCGEVLFAREAVDEAVEVLRGLEDREGPFTAAAAKDAWGTTRKYAIPLLEHLDASGVTSFDGQRRTLRN